jgi:GNAT superfamily N-acetyltransferase
MIRIVDDIEEKQRIARSILTALPEWFGIPESTENYIRESANEIMVASFEEEKANGFLCLKETGNATVELYVMGIRKEYHRQGIGRLLFRQARDAAAGAGYTFMQVKTVQMGKYEEYDRTNRFYLALGFREFEVFPTLWDEWNPCQVYVMSLE